MGKKKRRQMQRQPPGRLMDDQTWLRNKRHQELAAKYRAGTPKEAFIDPSGTEDEFEARLFHAWLNGREIPIEDLCILFNRDEATIRRWLEMTG
jgi:hypothetical protein